VLISGSTRGLITHRVRLFCHHGLRRGARRGLRPSRGRREDSVAIKFCEFANIRFAFWEASTHNDAHTTPSAMSSNATLGVETRACKRKRARRDATAANAGDAIPGLLNDIVITHALRSEHFDDPADLARLPAVSRAMRDAVAATGLEFVEIHEYEAVELGCLSVLQRLQRGDRLSRLENLCEAAAWGGNLEELKVLRTNGCPWDENTCSGAAEGGHLEVMQWLRANGCPWDEDTCEFAARGGHLEVLQWARSNGCPWNKNTCSGAASCGNLEVLQWARSNGCPWDEAMVHMAADEEHRDVFLWARENGCPMNDDAWNWANELGWLGGDADL